MLARPNQANKKSRPSGAGMTPPSGGFAILPGPASLFGSCNAVDLPFNAADYPLTPEMATDSMICFWNATKTISIGSSAMTDAAMMSG